MHVSGGTPATTHSHGTVTVDFQPRIRVYHRQCPSSQFPCAFQSSFRFIASASRSFFSCGFIARRVPVQPHPPVSKWPHLWPRKRRDAPASACKGPEVPTKGGRGLPKLDSACRLSKLCWSQGGIPRYMRMQLYLCSRLLMVSRSCAFC